MEEPISFGYWVRRRRRALDLTQGDLARRVGCAEVTIQKIEADERRPSRQIAGLLAEQLAIAADERGLFLLSARGELPADQLPPAAPVEDRAGNGARPGLPAQHAPETHDIPPHNLPVQLTSFVGREQDLAAIADLLAGARLLTLTGPGGTGKTRLALHAASTALAAFPDGVWLVELALLAAPALIAQAIASALGLREQPERALTATLSAHLRERRLLLILDNCEHLIDDCAQLAETLLHACPGLQILATSREPLGIGGEMVFRVQPLALPLSSELPPHDQLARFEAVRLFVERVRAVLPAFELSAANAAAVGQICQRLDGIPLAIELAAARARVLSVEQIAGRLDDRFRLLTGGSRTAMPRHQTLHALIDWSYDLLAEEERVLLRRLAVFAGDWTLDAAENVCELRKVSETADFPILDSQFSILDLLEHLVDKSLVQVEHDAGAARYHMLDTIRQYALEKLAASGEAEAVRRRHALHYLALAESLADRDPAERAARLEAAHDNLRAALTWSEQAADGAEIGLRLVRALADFWMLGGYWTEARSWLAGALAHSAGAEHTPAQAEVLLALGHLHALQNDYAAGQAVIARSLAIYQEQGDTANSAWLLNRLGWIAREQGDLATARARLEESLALYRALDDQLGIAEGLNALAQLALIQEDVEWAATLLGESQDLLRQQDDTHTLGWTLNHLGHVAQLRREYERAERLHQESLALFREHGPQHLGTAWALHGLGECALARGNRLAAGRWLAAGLAQFHSLGDQAGVAWCLAGLGGVAAASGRLELAATLWGAAEALRGSVPARLATATRATYEQAVAAARAATGEPAFAAAWAAGRALPTEQAIAQALDVAA